MCVRVRDERRDTQHMPRRLSPWCPREGRAKSLAWQQLEEGGLNARARRVGSSLTFEALRPRCTNWAMMLLVLLCLLAAAAQRPIVAVIDYGPADVGPGVPVSREAALAIVRANLLQYAEWVGRAALAGARIVVLPEDGLYGANFPSRESIASFLEPVVFPAASAPCYLPPDNATVAVQHLSCMARQHRIYVVANVGEMTADGHQVGARLTCAATTLTSLCPAWQYNTAVAFDPQGQLVARYRKSHLYYEPQFDAAAPEAVFFESPWGRIGLLVCFDAMFAEPMGALLRAGVRTVALGAWWVNVFPLAGPGAIFSGIARAHNITLLAASSGYNVMNSGSGIFDGYGTALAQGYNPTWQPQSQLLSARLPRVVGSTHRTVALLGRPSNVLDVVTFAAARHSRGTVSAAGGLCTATFQFGNATFGELYAVMVFSGPYAPQPGAPLFGLTLCAVVRCTDSDPSCASIYSGAPPTLGRYGERCGFLSSALMMCVDAAIHPRSASYLSRFDPRMALS